MKFRFWNVKALMVALCTLMTLALVFGGGAGCKTMTHPDGTVEQSIDVDTLMLLIGHLPQFAEIIRDLRDTIDPPEAPETAEERAARLELQAEIRERLLRMFERYIENQRAPSNDDLEPTESEE